MNVKLADRTLDFNFDRIFGQNSEQKNVYEAVEHVIDGVMDGFNGSILSYGQVGCLPFFQERHGFPTCR